MGAELPAEVDVAAALGQLELELVALEQHPEQSVEGSAVGAVGLTLEGAVGEEDAAETEEGGGEDGADFLGGRVAEGAGRAQGRRADFLILFHLFFYEINQLLATAVTCTASAPPRKSTAAPSPPAPASPPAPSPAAAAVPPPPPPSGRAAPPDSGSPLPAAALGPR